MACYKTKKIEASLLKKGFQVNNGSNHRIYCYYNGEKKTDIFTFISRGHKEYCDRLLAAMRSQLDLSNQEFDDVVECPMTKEALHELYLKKERIKE